MKLAHFARSSLLSLLLFSIGIPGALLYALSSVSVGSGVGGPFDFPTGAFELGLSLGFAVFALPFLIGTVVGLPIATLMQTFGLPLMNDVTVSVHHGTLTFGSTTATAQLIGLTIQLAFYTLILYGREQIQQMLQGQSSQKNQ